MGIELHYHIMCPHARSALITVKALGLDVKHVIVDPTKGGARTPEYLKLNPTHTIPTLVDDGFTLFESRAIIIYLAAKYGASSGLYPITDLQAKANVDKIIFFDVTSYLPALRKAFFPAYFKKGDASEEELKDLVDKAAILETILGQQKFFAGDQVTLADISVAASVPYLKIILPRFWTPFFQQWYARVVEALPAVGEVNEQGEAHLQERLKNN